jgi:hypothetical protein
LQRRGKCREGKMASREARRGGVGFLSARDGLGLGCTQWKRLEGLCGVLGRCCGLSPVVRSQSSGACCANSQTHGFSDRAQKSCHGQGEWGLEHAGQRWRGDVASMPCRFMCCQEGKGACMGGNATHALGVHGACAARSERGLWGGQRAAWAAAGHWASTMVASGLWWRGGRGWFASYALVSTSML